MAPLSWPEAVYHLDRGLGLAVCVRHRGAHVFDGVGCNAGPRPGLDRWTRQRRARDPAPEPAPVPRVDIDSAALAAGIAAALDALLERRRAERERRGTVMETVE